MGAEIQLGWNNNQLRAGAAGAAAIVNRASADMKKSLGGISSGLGAGLGFGIFDTAKNLITGATGALYDATVTADSLRNGMTALEGSVTSANARLDEMRTLAKDPGLGFEQVVRGDISLRSVGLSAELSTRAMKEFGNALTLVGKGEADLDGVLLAITQIVSKGKVSAEEINQIAERVPQIRKVMQEAFGTADTEAIQKMGVPVERFVETVVQAFERTIPRALVGLQGKIDNFTDASTSRLADFGDGFSKGLLGPLSEATDAMEKSSQQSKAFGESLGFMTAGAIDFGKAILGAVTFSLDGLGDLASKITVAQLSLLGFKQIAQQSEAETVRLKDAELAAARVADDLARHQREAETATKRLSDARAEATRRANEQAAAEAKLTAETIKNTNAARENFLTERGKTSDLYLTDAEKLEKVKERIAKIDADMNKTIGQKGGEEITYKLMAAREQAMQELLQLSKSIAAENEKGNTADAKSLRASAEKVADKERSLQLFDLELSIQQALAKGQDEKARKLQQEAEIIETTARLVSELGLSYEDAAKKATQLVQARAAAEARESGRDDNGRRKIQGYSQDQGTAADARDRAQKKTNQARQNYDDSIQKFFGNTSRVDTRGLPAGGRTPAAESNKDSGFTELTSAFDAFATKTTEIFEKALN
jgi:tape measure domain-containing protein